MRHSVHSYFFKGVQFFRRYILRRSVVAAILLLGTLFLGGALVSHSATDSSWLYGTTTNSVPSNFFGAFGANAAAFLIYLFGASAYLVVAMLSVATYFMVARRSFSAEWERLVAGFGIAALVPVVSFIHGKDLSLAPFAGGLVGNRLGTTITKTFDVFGGTLFAYTMLAVCLLLFFQISFMSVARAGIATGRFLASRERCWRPAYAGTRYVFQFFYRPIYAAGYFIHALYYDSLVPDELYSVGLYEPALDDDDFSTVSLQESEDVQPDVHDDVARETVVQQKQPIAQVAARVSDEKKDFQKEVGETLSHEYHLPDTSIFIGVKDVRQSKEMKAELEARAHVLEEKLERFGVKGSVTAIKYGPVVTLFEYQPGIDTKLSKIVALEDDLALALQALSIRIIAPIPGRSVVGFEVANQKRQDVLFSKVIRSDAYQKGKQALPLILGEDTVGEQVVADLAKMPHVLIAGSTGSGKSVALNAMLVSMLCRLSPDDLRLILIDPKRLEFASYADIAHLIFPIITNPKRATMALRWVVKEMEDRYEKMAASGARNIFDYRKNNKAESMPYIVVVIDELADLMMTAGRDCEELITRITQMARAAGIHLIVATQRPSVDVITGLIKVNFPSRISFRVTSKIDSRTILDTIGADKLLGRGDMLFLDAGAIVRRVHGAFVSDKEIEDVVAHIRAEREPSYRDLVDEVSEHEKEMLQDGDDELYGSVLDFLENVDEVSISLLQRKFRIGYNRSARIIDMLESQGVVLPADGGKMRKVVRE